MEGPNKRRRRHIDFAVHEHEDSESDATDELEEADQMSVQYEHADSVTSEVAADPPTESIALHTVNPSTFAVGGALKRNPDGSVVATLVNNKSEKRQKVC